MPRRKKVIVVESSDEDEAPLTPAKSKGSIEAAFARAGASISPTKQRTLPTRTALSPAAKRSKKSAPSSQSNSPAGKSKIKEIKAKSISSFFNSATQKQQSRPSNSPEKRDVDALDLEDDIIQDSSDEGKVKNKVSRAAPLNGNRKRKIDSIDSTSNGVSGHGGPKFLKPSQDLKTGSQSVPSTAAVAITEQRPWTDQYGPVNLDELAVHKRKVQDLRDCITRTISGNARSRLIVLKGGAGTGKTTTVNLLADGLGLGVTEWHNPDSGRGGEGVASITAQFEDFVSRTSLFGTLNFGGEEDSKVPAQQEDQNYVVLVEEFPNTFSRSSSTLQGFRRAVMHYLAATTPSPDDFFGQNKRDDVAVVPIIMVISESLLTTSTASADSFTAHRLLGPEILNHQGTAVFEFNPIAPTFMSKALDLILKKEARKSGRRFAPGPAVLKHLSETGDIRSAISALEFFCVHQGSEADWSGKINFGKTKKGDNDKALTAMERQSLQMITQRENTLGIFHAVGKVVYNKREPPVAGTKCPPQPPSYHPQHARPKVSEVDIDSLLNELGTDISVFVSALHENYVLSCSGIDEEDTLDSICGCIDALSEADLLCPDRFTTGAPRSTWQATANDNLRQDAISFFTSVQGCLFHLPHPVKRTSPPTDYITSRGKTAGKSVAFQMLYPTSLRLWRKKEQIEELIDQFNSKFRNNELDDGLKSRPSATNSGGIESWRRRNNTSYDIRNTKSNEQDVGDVVRLLRGSSRSEILLERLPGMNSIQGRKPFTQRSALGQLIYKIVHLSGLASSLTPEGDQEQEEPQEGEEWTTDKPVEDTGDAAWRKSVGIVSKTAEGKVVIRKDLEKLVLSDDDIEDDE